MKKLFGLLAALFLSAFPAAAEIQVTNVSNSGPGSLRAAIEAGNSAAVSDTITFAIPGDGPHTIAVTEALPEITAPLFVDGSTQPGYVDTPKIIVSGDGTPGVDGFQLASASRLKALHVVGFGGRGVFVGPSDGASISESVISGNGEEGVKTFGAANFVVQYSKIGTDAAGAVAAPNGQSGVYIEQSPGAIVRNSTISGNNLYGIAVLGPESASAKILGNVIGLDVTATYRIPNTRTGVLIHNTAYAVVGGSTAAERNVISGNLRHGVNLDGAPPTETYPEPHYGHKGFNHHNRVIGNFIGTDGTGKRAIGNGLSGVLIYHSQNNTVGGSGAGLSNVISGNLQHGVSIIGDPDNSALNFRADSNTVSVNRIGLAVSASPELPNAQHGVAVSNGRNNKITGATIRYNNGWGIRIVGDSSTSNTQNNNTVTNNDDGQIYIQPSAAAKRR